MNKPLKMKIAASVLALALLGVTGALWAGPKWVLWCESHPMLTSVQVIHGCYDTEREARAAMKRHNDRYHNGLPIASAEYDSWDAFC